MSEFLRGYLHKTVTLECPECGKEENIAYDETDPNILSKFSSFDLVRTESQIFVFLCRDCGARFYVPRR